MWSHVSSAVAVHASKRGGVEDGSSGEYTFTLLDHCMVILQSRDVLGYYGAGPEEHSLICLSTLTHALHVGEDSYFES